MSSRRCGVASMRKTRPMPRRLPTSRRTTLSDAKAAAESNRLEATLPAVGPSDEPPVWRQVATFCKGVQDDQQGSLSIENLVGKFTLVPSTADAPEELPEVELNTTFFLSVVPRGGQLGMISALRFVG